MTHESTAAAAQAPFKPQIIHDAKGEPAFAVIPYAESLALSEQKKSTVPHAVVNLVFDNGWSPVRAWREYLGLTQAAVAERLGISQAAFAQQEAPGKRLRKTTLAKLARAMGLGLEQLDF